MQESTPIIKAKQKYEALHIDAKSYKSYTY